MRNITYTGKIKYADKIYQGIHKPIISEEIFELAQKIHKKRIRKFRIYKNFFFGGLMNCKECGYKMSPCFTNKWKQGKLKRYFYYRCISTNKKGWQSCPIKQVSAERLENYVLENLERISLDKDYIENLVFRLNHNLKTPRHTKCEPLQACSKFSKFETKTITSILKNFLSALARKKGIDKNLLAKKFVHKIIYSLENIKISLFYEQNPKNFRETKNPTLACEAGDDGGKLFVTKRKNRVFSQNFQFVSNKTNAQIKRFQTFSIILPNLIHQSKKKNLKKR